MVYFLRIKVYTKVTFWLCGVAEGEENNVIAFFVRTFLLYLPEKAFEELKVKNSCGT